MFIPKEIYESFSKKTQKEIDDVLVKIDGYVETNHSYSDLYPQYIYFKFNTKYSLKDDAAFFASALDKAKGQYDKQKYILELERENRELKKLKGSIDNIKNYLKEE